MQTASVDTCQELVDSNLIIHDNVIPKEASLAKALLEDSDPKARANKMFLALPPDFDSLLDKLLIYK
jgi:hypothetical protein